MRRATVLSTCALIVVLLYSVVVAAQAPPPPPPPPPPAHISGAAGTVPHAPKVVESILAAQKYLELTDAQVQQWKDVQSTKKQQLEELNGQVRELEQQLESALSETNPSAGTVGQLMIQLRSARQERNKIWQSSAEAVNGILTPAQAEKVESAGKALELRPVIEALVGAGFLAPPPPPPPPPPPAHMSGAGKVVRTPHGFEAPKAVIPHHAPEM